MPATIKALLDSATARLNATSDSPRLDAELLLGQILDKSRGQLLARPEQAIDDSAQREFESLLLARLQGTPLAYLAGQREFWSLPLKLTRDTLIPRPDTELLVETALECIPEDKAWKIADLGTGSGAISLAIASERLLCRITATDVSRAALDVARENAAQLGLGNLEFCCGNWFAPLPDMRFHLIVSNPPYVREGDPHLDEGDVRFEPRRALVSGPDGLDAIRHLIERAPQHLLPDGWLLLEHGYDQAEAVRELFDTRGFKSVRSLRDLSGQERVTLGQFPV
ncbi:MAG TPA: peptide chain release factor N(5)-glutamine methyltransferase [Gammaproteobacteria bacterium]